MKRQFRKSPVLCSSNYDNTGVIATQADMTAFINDNYIIDSIIEEVNDYDSNWEYDTPEKFAAACEKRLKKTLKDKIAYYDLKVKGDPVSLVSKKIWKELKDAASSGDFDVDDY